MGPKISPRQHIFILYFYLIIIILSAHKYILKFI